MNTKYWEAIAEPQKENNRGIVKGDVRNQKLEAILRTVYTSM